MLQAREKACIFLLLAGVALAGGALAQEPEERDASPDFKRIGAEPVDHAERIICCGKSCRDCDLPEIMTRTILESMHAAQVDAMGVICPSCFDSFDTGQLRLARKYELGFTVPPVYYFQLLALAQGRQPAEVGLDKHKLKPDKLLAHMVAG